MYSRFQYTNRDNFYKVLSKENPEEVDISKELERYLKLFGMPVNYTSENNITTKYRGYEYEFTTFNEWGEIRVMALFAHCNAHNTEQILQIHKLINEISIHSSPAVAWLLDDELYSVANMRLESGKISPNDFQYIMESCDYAIREFSSRSIFYKSLRECCELKTY
mgnify:FL=1